MIQPSADTEQGTQLSQTLCLNYVMSHPVAYRDYWTPKVSKRPYWHRYNFTTILHAINDGDAAIYCGRGSGKSYAILEPEISYFAINHPGEESMVTSLRWTHIVDRMERAIEYFTKIPFFKQFINEHGIKRSPIYEISLRNGHIIYGVAIGDDAEARQAQGKHVSRLMIEEAHQYPERGFMKVSGSTDPRGCRTLMIGVPDGRMDTPFRKADISYSSFKGRNIHLSQRSDPFFNHERKQKAIEFYKGLDTEMFKQEVDAEWGQPTWGAWDMDAIYRCASEKVQKNELSVSREQIEAMRFEPAAFLADLPRRMHEGRVIVAADIGYTQPTSIGVFEHYDGKWYLLCRVELINKMEHDDQTRFIDEVGRRFDAEWIAIDTSEGEGRDIAHLLEKGNWKGRVERCGFQETLLSGYKPLALNDKGEWASEEEWESTKSVTTRVLRNMFAYQRFVLPKHDEKIYVDFNSEVEHKTQEGLTRIITPSTVHITDMFRVFALVIHKANPPVPPTPPEAESSWDIEVGIRQIWGGRPGGRRR